MQSIEYTKTEMVTLDADAVIQLVGDCCQMIREKKSFDFDDPSSLDDTAYYNITGLKKGMECLNC